MYANGTNPPVPTCGWKMIPSDPSDRKHLIKTETLTFLENRRDFRNEAAANAAILAFICYYIFYKCLNKIKKTLLIEIHISVFTFFSRFLNLILHVSQCPSLKCNLGKFYNESPA